MKSWSTKNIIFAIGLIALIAIASFGGYKWFVKGELRIDTIIYLCLISAYLLNTIANGRTRLEDQDEREVYLSRKASEISYLILVVCLGMVLFIAEGTGNLAQFTNIPLVICFSLAILIYPTVRAILFYMQR